MDLGHYILTPPAAETRLAAMGRSDPTPPGRIYPLLESFPSDLIRLGAITQRSVLLRSITARAAAISRWVNRPESISPQARITSTLATRPLQARPTRSASARKERKPPPSLRESEELR